MGEDFFPCANHYLQRALRKEDLGENPGREKAYGRKLTVACQYLSKLFNLIAYVLLRNWMKLFKARETIYPMRFCYLGSGALFIEGMRGFDELDFLEVNIVD